MGGGGKFWKNTALLLKQFLSSVFLLTTGIHLKVFTELLAVENSSEPECCRKKKKYCLLLIASESVEPFK